MKLKISETIIQIKYIYIINNFFLTIYKYKKYKYIYNNSNMFLFPLNVTFYPKMYDILTLNK